MYDRVEVKPKGDIRMTRGEFKRFEEDCKKSWEELGESGEPNKPEYLSVYLNMCPACHLSHLVTLVRDRNAYPSQDCKFCPIDKWRKYAKKKALMRGKAACTSDRKTYGGWRDTLWVNEDYEKFSRWVEERKSAAKEVAKLRWTFLKVYEKVVITYERGERYEEH
jgi:hypothetical protein